MEPKSRSRPSTRDAGDDSDQDPSPTVPRTSPRSKLKTGDKTDTKCVHQSPTGANRDCEEDEEKEDAYFSVVSVILKFLYLLRILICLIPQHGYIQPDEYFQFTEPIAGNIFHSKVYIPWEFNRSHPLRNTLLPTLFSGSAFYFLNKISSDPSAYWLMVLPRLLITLFSLASDWAISNLLWRYEENAGAKKKSSSGDQITIKPSLHNSVGVCNIRLLYASSYICFTYCTHTFTNSIELVLFSVLIMLTLSYHKLTAKDGVAHGHVIGTILSLGIFNRPTFVIFASYPIIWSIIGHPKIRISYRDCIKKTLLLAPSFLIVSLIAIASDVIYFSDIDKVDIWTLKFGNIFSVLSHNLILTPINFISYNSQTKNLSNHGLHPRYFHLLVNVPILFGAMAIFFAKDIRKFILSLFFIRHKLRYHNLDRNMMVSTTILSLIGLSIFPHQEPRFLIPLLVTFSYLYRHLIRIKSFIIFWLIFNASLVYMFGFVHQAGVTKSIFYLHDVIRSDASHKHLLDANPVNRNLLDAKRVDAVHIIFTSMYLPPQHLLNIKDGNDKITIFDLSIKKFPDAVKSHFDVISKSNLKSNITSYLVGPSCLDADIQKIIGNIKPPKDGKTKDAKLLASFFPHFSHETLKQSIEILKSSGKDFRKAFSMNIWKIN